MNWRTIRLELAGGTCFPQGSASRAYLLRLPLDDAGYIDQAALQGDPCRATVRRFWASEPDLYGQVEPNSSGWIFRFSGDGRAERRMHLEAQSLVEGEKIFVQEADGTRLPFCVKATGLGRPSKAK